VDAVTLSLSSGSATEHTRTRLDDRVGEVSCVLPFGGRRERVRRRNRPKVVEPAPRGPGRGSMTPSASGGSDGQRTQEVGPSGGLRRSDAVRLGRARTAGRRPAGEEWLDRIRLERPGEEVTLAAVALLPLEL
jgi:hypothetical protein